MRDRTLVPLGHMLSHGFSHRLDFFAQRYSRWHRRFNGLSMSFFLLNDPKSRRTSEKSSELTRVRFHESESRTVGSRAETAECDERLVRSNPPKLQALCQTKGNKDNPNHPLRELPQAGREGTRPELTPCWLRGLGARCLSSPSVTERGILDSSAPRASVSG